MIKNLEDKLQELEKEKQDLEKRFSEKMKVLEREKRELMTEADKKLLILKEKEKVFSSYNLIFWLKNKQIFRNIN